MRSGMEKTLHSLLPPVCSANLTNYLLRFLMDYWGMDRVATLAPLLFSVLMTVGMIGMGCSFSSVEA